MSRPDVFVTVCPRTPARLGMAIQTLVAWGAEQAAGRVGDVVIQWVRAPTSPFPGLRHLQDLLTADAIPGDFHHVTLDADAGPESQRHRHANAAWLARTDPYCVVDDDAIPFLSRRLRDDGKVEAPWPAYAAGLLAANPDLVMLAPLPTPGYNDPGTLRAWLAHQLGPAEAEGLIGRLAIPDQDAHLWRVLTVGGIRVVRRGAIPDDVKDLPPVQPERGGGYDIPLGQWLRGSADVDRCAYLARLGCLHLGYDRSVVWGGDAPGG